MNSKIYVVTGASRGIGLEFVKQIISSNDIVFACVRNINSSDELLHLISKSKDHVFPITLDTTKIDSINVYDK